MRPGGIGAFHLGARWGGTVSCRAPGIQCGERCASQGAQAGHTQAARLFPGDNRHASVLPSGFGQSTARSDNPERKARLGSKLGKVHLQLAVGSREQQGWRVVGPSATDHRRPTGSCSISEFHPRIHCQQLHFSSLACSSGAEGLWGRPAVRKLATRLTRQSFS